MNLLKFLVKKKQYEKKLPARAEAPSPELLEEMMSWARDTSKRDAETVSKPINLGTYKQVFLRNNCAILKRRSNHLKSAPLQEIYALLKMRVNQAIEQGAQIPRFYGRKYYSGQQEMKDYSLLNFQDLTNYIEVQEQVPGQMLAALFAEKRNAREILSNIPQEHYTGLLKTHLLLNYYGIRSEIHNKNVLYDEKTGFWVVDLEASKKGPQEKFVLEKVAETVLSIQNNVFCVYRTKPKPFDSIIRKKLRVAATEAVKEISKQTAKDRAR